MFGTIFDGEIRVETVKIDNIVKYKSLNVSFLCIELLYKITITIKIIARVILLNYVICYRSHAGTCLQRILSFW